MEQYNREQYSNNNPAYYRDSPAYYNNNDNPAYYNNNDNPAYYNEDEIVTQPITVSKESLSYPLDPGRMNFSESHEKVERNQADHLNSTGEDYVSREELLKELRNIARNEARNLQENSCKNEEAYFHPPASPSKHPLEYLREIYQTKDFKGRQKRRKIEQELSESSMDETENQNFKSFNDFDEDIFKFDINTKLFNCPWEDCDKAFPSLSRIKRHYIIHTDIKPFKCLNAGCNRRFSRKDNMLQHYRVHCPFADQLHRPS